MSGRTGEPFGRGASLIATPADGAPEASVRLTALQMCISTDCQCYGAGCEWCAYGWDE